MACKSKCERHGHGHWCYQNGVWCMPESRPLIIKVPRELLFPSKNKHPLPTGKKLKVDVVGLGKTYEMPPCPNSKTSTCEVCCLRLGCPQR